VNDHVFLVIERDGRAGTNATFKKIFKIGKESAQEPTSRRYWRKSVGETWSE
jgi:hypothetical protein